MTHGEIVFGVDTHKDIHVQRSSTRLAAALHERVPVSERGCRGIGRSCGSSRFPTYFGSSPGASSFAPEGWAGVGRQRSLPMSAFEPTARMPRFD
jgi:hypothetical protein